MAARYDADVPRIVLTAIGDDRAGLVAALSEVVAAHGGNWERSQMAELAGKFAGIVVVSVPDERAEQMTRALRSLGGLLEVSAHPGAEMDTAADAVLTIDLLGTDRPGIVLEVSGVLNRHQLSIETIETMTREAPMAGASCSRRTWWCGFQSPPTCQRCGRISSDWPTSCWWTSLLGSSGPTCLVECRAVTDFGAPSP